MKKLILYLYVILPTIFFGVPVLISTELGSVAFHYYKTIYPDISILLTVFIYYVLFGILIYLLVKNIHSEGNLVKSRFGNSLILFSSIGFIVPLSYSRIILMPFLIILTSRYHLNVLSKIFLLSTGMFVLLFQGQRFFIIFVLLILFRNRIAKLNLIHFLFYSLLGILLLVFILEPLKRGMISSQYDYNIFGLVEHLQPIYVVNYYGLDVDFDFQQFLVESIPLVKSLFHQQGSVEFLGKLILPQELIDNGSRVGSASSVFFKPLVFCLACFIVVGYFRVLRAINNKLLYSSVLNYMVLFGPYFIRRSFTSYLIDLIILFFMVVVVIPVFNAKGN